VNINKARMKRRKRGQDVLNQRIKRMLSPKSVVGSLIGEFENEEKIAAELRKIIKNGRQEPRPKRCSSCKCEKFYKKGFMYVQLGTLLGMGRNSFKRNIPVQKYACVNCGYVTHLEGKEALYHWVTGRITKN